MRILQLYFLVVFLIANNIYGQKDVSVDSLHLEKLLSTIQDNLQTDKVAVSLQLADSAVYIAKQTNNPAILIKALLSKSKVLWNIDKFDEAMVLSEQALQIADTYEFSNEKADIWQNTAYIFQRKNEKNKAIEVILKALVLYEKNNNIKGIADSYALMGVLNASLGKLDKGIVYFNKALVLHQQLGDKDKIVTNLLNIGTACFFDNQLEKAKKYFFRALATTPKNNLDVRNILLMNIATIYQHTKQLDSAYYYQVLAIKSTEKINDEYILSTLYYNAATVKFEQHDLDSTNYYALKGLALASKLKKYDRQIGNLLMISQVDSVRGDLKGELSIFKRIVKIKDSILQQERESIADEMEVKYNNLKKDEIINLQNNNLKIANEKNRLFRVVIIISLLLLVISLVFAITLNKLLRKNKKIHQIEKSQMLLQLKEREKELVSIALQIEQKNRLIDTIYHKLKKTLQHPTSIEKELNNILIDVKISFNVQKDIAVFTEKFENLHHDFIAKLKNDYPELTIKEIKFLSFLKIGLSTKQVASIQNVTPAAVHKMRYRIKKKINLEKDVSLDDFVVQL